jgi:hypothetical protein
MNFSKRGHASGTSSISVCPLESFAMVAPFEASKLKLERSAEHLQELERAATMYLSEKPCAIVVEPFPGLHEEMGTQSWNARIRKPVPMKFAALVGDVIHNLRSALDLLVCDLVKINGQNTADVYFPFCPSAKHLSDAIRDRKIFRAGSDIVRLIESMKPYKGGNIALRAIHDLDVTDKHQALLPVLGAVSVPLGALLGPNVAPAVRNFSTIIDHDGQMVIGTPNILQVPLGTELPARFFLVLDFGPPTGNSPVIEGLHRLAKEASRVFLALTALRPGAVFPVVPPRPKGSKP